MSAEHPPPTAAILRIAAVCFVRELAPNQGHHPVREVLTVRKRGTTAFMQPGGKLEPGEGPAQCAAREIREELGVPLDPAVLIPLGEHWAPAANEADTRVHAHVLLAPAAALPERITVRAEIAEACWCPIEQPPPDRTWAPLMTAHILPALRALRDLPR